MSEHRSFPKPTPRLQERMQQRREAMRAWLECCAAVDHRDGYKCRVCGRKTRKTLTLCPERLEHHHLVGRRIAPALICDVRNVVTLCHLHHTLITRHELRVEAAVEHMFEYEGRVYANADHPLHFT